MKSTPTIRVRLTAWFLALLAILFCVLGLLLHLYLGHTLRQNLDRSLLHRAGQLLAIRDLEQAMTEGRFSADPGEVVGLYDARGEPIHVLSPGESGRLVEQDQIEHALARGPLLVTARGRDGRSIRAYLVAYRPSPDQPPLGRAALLLVGRPMDNITSALRAVLQTLLIVAPITLLLSAGGGLFLARRALKPVDRMIRTTREIEDTDLSRRIDVRTDDELGRLGATINAMLDRLERAFSRQRQFTGDASHELRTPLAVIEAEATLALRRDRSPEDYRAALGSIAEEAAQMKRLVDQLLAVARSEGGKNELPLERVEPARIAAEVVAAMAPLAEDKGVSLQCDEGQPVALTADREGLRRVLVNLLDNAIRYTDPGGSVIVSVMREGDDVCLTVRDTGIGISPEHLPHIFDRFYRVQTSRSRTEGGTGLGLALCDAIVKAHGGTIRAESEAGAGTLIVVRIPQR